MYFRLFVACVVAKLGSKLRTYCKIYQVGKILTVQLTAQWLPLPASNSRKISDLFSVLQILIRKERKKRNEEKACHIIVLQKTSGKRNTSTCTYAVDKHLDSYSLVSKHPHSLDEAYL